MTGDARLKKRRAAEESGLVHSDNGAQPGAPVVSETVHSPELSCSTSSDCYVVGSSGTSSNIQGRTDTAFDSMDKSAQCARNDDGKENGTEFVIVDLAVIDSLIQLVDCPECGEKSITFSKAKKEYGLCPKLVVTCSSCDFREERFSSPRVADETDTKIRPFEVNLRAMKAINSIGKAATVLSDFFAVMNI
ncbi:hypothetical protein HPB52_025338 [Rhipicephalus sanguineus]|uniref:Mutator-like transposase domain-containing protein n=1 Tax=Rhipicephalus sanguineus TaxID=34632 RepID=A0A9D4TD50_RHISA|nr:hypothetical protein HPB52_025338 [Rhipicephalus sanguineus]